MLKSINDAAIQYPVYLNFKKTGHLFIVKKDPHSVFD